MSNPGRPRSFDEHAVLDAALKVFWTKGYEAAGMQDLVDAMGIGRQSLYNAFGDKRGLYRRAILHYGERVTRPILDDLARAEDPAQALSELLDRWECQMTDPECRGCLLTNSSVDAVIAEDAELASALESQRTALIDALTAVIEAAQRTGRVSRAGSPSSLAGMVAVFGWGAAAVGRGRHNPESVRVAIDGLRAVLFAEQGIDAAGA